MGFLIAEFSRATRSSSSLNTTKQGEFWVNRTGRIFFFGLNSLSATGDEGLVQNLLSCWSVCRILRQEQSQLPANLSQKSAVKVNQGRKRMLKVVPFTHLIEAVVNHFDQRRGINVRVDFHSPVALDYFHTKIQRILTDTDIKKKKKSMNNFVKTPRSHSLLATQQAYRGIECPFKS